MRQIRVCVKRNGSLRVTSNDYLKTTTNGSLRVTSNGSLRVTKINNDKAKWCIVNRYSVIEKIILQFNTMRSPGRR